MFKPDEAELVRRWLTSPVWTEVIAPRLKQRRDAAVLKLILTPSERGKDQEDDPTLRARILEDDWMLRGFQSELEIHDYNQRRDELAQQLAANP
jgi:hypothetical protein